jgi:hypothetical protein
MSRNLVFGVTALLLCGAAANATTSSGSLAIQCQVDASIVLVISADVAGITLGGTSSAATATLPEVSYYGTPNGAIGGTNVTKSSNGTSFTLTTSFDVTVNEANLTTPANGYTLTAELQTLDTTNTWTVGAATPVLSSGTGNVTTTGVFGSQTQTTLALQVPITEATTNISNTINLVATAN